MNDISLGDEVRDVITGFEGIAIVRQEGLFEPTSVKVQPRTLTDDKKPMDPVWFEESRLERTKKSIYFANDECSITAKELGEARKTEG